MRTGHCTLLQGLEEQYRHEHPLPGHFPGDFRQHYRTESGGRASIRLHAVRPFGNGRQPGPYVHGEPRDGARGRTRDRVHARDFRLTSIKIFDPHRKDPRGKRQLSCDSCCDDHHRHRHRDTDQPGGVGLILLVIPAVFLLGGAFGVIGERHLQFQSQDGRSGGHAGHVPPDVPFRGTHTDRELNWGAQRARSI